MSYETASKREISPPLKSVEEAKRGVILRSLQVSKAPSTVAYEILYTLNMKLLSMPLPGHVKMAKLGYNERNSYSRLELGKINSRQHSTCWELQYSHMYWNLECRRRERTEALETLIDRYDIPLNKDTKILTRPKKHMFDRPRICYSIGLWAYSLWIK